MRRLRNEGNATLGIVENRVGGVDFEPMDQVERSVADGPVENLVDFEEEGDVSIALKSKRMKRET